MPGKASMAAAMGGTVLRAVDTRVTAEAEELTELDLQSVAPGKIVEVSTKQGDFWIAITAETAVVPVMVHSEDQVSGVVIMTSAQGHRLNMSPGNTLVRRFVKVGERFDVGLNSKSAGKVRKIMVL